jgi:hypothetical protein
VREEAEEEDEEEEQDEEEEDEEEEEERRKRKRRNNPLQRTTIGPAAWESGNAVVSGREVWYASCPRTRKVSVVKP